MKTPAEIIVAIETYQLWVTWHRSSPKCHVCPNWDSSAIFRADTLEEAVEGCITNLRNKGKVPPL